MAVSVTRAKRSRPAVPATLEIGGDAHVTSCPSCGRPIGDGTMRCPGCGAWLVLDVPIRRAGLFVAVGMALGTLVGGSVMAAAMTIDRTQARAPSTAATALTAPAAGSSVAPSLAAAPVAPGVGLAALREAAAVDERLVAGAATLQAAAAGQPFDTFAVATALRALAADAAIGSDVAGRLRDWDDAAAVQAQLDGLYGQTRSTARDALAAPFLDGEAYRAAASRMAQVLAGLPAVDAAVRALASSSGIELPPAAASP